MLKGLGLKLKLAAAMDIPKLKTDLETARQILSDAGKEDLIDDILGNLKKGLKAAGIDIPL